MFGKVLNTPLVKNVQLCSNSFHLSVANATEHTHTHTHTHTYTHTHRHKHYSKEKYRSEIALI